jgi:hypothetical protein
VKKALIVGFAIVVWLPFLYREWARAPARAPQQKADLDGRTAEELLEQIEGTPAPPPPEKVADPEPEPDEEEEEGEEAPAEEEAHEPEPEAPAHPPAEGTEPAREGEEGAEPEKPPFKLPPSGPVPVLSKAFESEVRDALWAASRERELQRFFTGAGLPADELDLIRCQRTVCKVELHTTKASNELYPDIFKAAHESFGAELGVLPQPAQSEDEQGRIQLYLLRPGYKLSDLGE